MPVANGVAAPPTPSWGKVIDQARCIGCHACTTACKSENEVPLSVTRTYVKYVDVGVFPAARRAFQVTRCNQCDDPPCVAACPTAAMHRRPDGIVDFDKSICIGCKACIAACPYDAIFINPEDHSAEKCNFCAHRLDVGLEPACVVVCPTEAILVGDLNDPSTRVSRYVNRDTVTVRRPEKQTKPKLWYHGAHQATLDPLAAQRPPGDIYLWSEQPTGSHIVPAGNDGPGASSAAAVLSYDVAHRAPWDWRVSLYTWTKSLAAGFYLVPALLVAAGLIDSNSQLWLQTAPALALAFLAVTGLILIWDLEHPARFLLIFVRPQWRSWLVRGGVIITGYGLALVAHLASSLAGSGPPRWLLPIGALLALLAAVYTAFLFAQARARDLWQSPLLPAHMAVQAAVAGLAGLLLLEAITGGDSRTMLETLLAAVAAIHLLLVAGEFTVGHPTAHAARAAHNITSGRFRSVFWFGNAALLVAVAAPWLGTVAAVAALAGLLAFEHAYVQGGQSVPLA